ncbi:MAG: polysaccharide deacetylase family protein [Actinobacteria bacterium]|nr:polysaccharide deacetylase family protein [Actinomycetota bacterium]
MVDTGDAAPGEPVVALTFDDGPDPRWTPQILDILAENDVTATFFVLGRVAQQYPELLDRIVREGHRIGNHTSSHPRLPRLSDQGVADEIGPIDAWFAYRGIETRCVRPPYGEVNERVDNIIRTASGNDHTMLWSIDTRDWQRPAAGTIVERITSQLQPGAVILMHDGGGERAATVEATAQVIPLIKAAGYGIRPVC